MLRAALLLALSLTACAGPTPASTVRGAPPPPPPDPARATKWEGGLATVLRTDAEAQAYRAREAAQAPADPSRGVVMGSIDRRAIRQVISDHAAELRSCYEEQLAIDPTLAGTVSVKWVIDDSGRVSGEPRVVALTPATPRADALAACMMSRIVTWEFPRPRSGGIAVVTYPWVFRRR